MWDKNSCPSWADCSLIQEPAYIELYKHCLLSHVWTELGQSVIEATSHPVKRSCSQSWPALDSWLFCEVNIVSFTLFHRGFWVLWSRSVRSRWKTEESQMHKGENTHTQSQAHHHLVCNDLRNIEGGGNNWCHLSHSLEEGRTVRGSCPTVSRGDLTYKYGVNA